MVGYHLWIGQFLTVMLLIPTKSDMRVRSTCDLTGDQAWNHRNVKDNLKFWWNSLTLVQADAVDKKTFGLHLTRYDRKRNGYINQTIDPTHSRQAVTVSRNYSGDIPVGLVWQEFDSKPNSGILYGRTDQHGLFTGDDLVFIYPDFRTGLMGRFKNGLLVNGVEVRITAERCSKGLKELKFKTKNPGFIWRRFADDFGLMKLPMDPHERGSVYVGNSEEKDGGEGLFAKRNFLPGEIVSYFGGLRTWEDLFLFDNMTDSDYWTAHAYYLHLSELAPSHWNLDDELVIDIPVGFREIDEYRTTLGHKVNHKFGGRNQNLLFDAVHHPVLGYIGCLISNKPIRRGDELFVDYGYSLEFSPPWYKKLYKLYNYRKI